VSGLRIDPRLRRSARALAIIAVAVLVALAAGLVLAGQLSGGLPFEGQRTVRVAVADAKGVLAGKNEVRWAGVVVGRITAVERRDGRPLLTAEIDGDAPPLYRDARFRLRPQTALNDMFLDVVERGAASAGELSEDDVLDAGRTRTPVDVAEVLNLFSGEVRDRTGRLLVELSEGLPDGGEQLRAAFAALAPFVASASELGRVIGERDEATRRIVPRARRIAEEVAGRQDALRGLVDRAATTFDALGARRAAIDASLAELSTTLTAMRSSFARLGTTLDVVRPALSELRPVARRLPAGLRSLERIAADADPALRGARPALRALRPTLQRVPATADGLTGAADALSPWMPRLDRVTAGVERCRRPLQKFFAWTMSTLKFGNRTNLTTSPRGVLGVSGADLTGTRSNLVPAIGCADGEPAR